jgi:ribosomal protein L17
MFEIVPNGSTKETLAKARDTREQMEQLLTITL